MVYQGKIKAVYQGKIKAVYQGKIFLKPGCLWITQFYNWASEYSLMHSPMASKKINPKCRKINSITTSNQGNYAGSPEVRI